MLVAWGSLEHALRTRRFASLDNPGMTVLFVGLGYIALDCSIMSHTRHRVRHPIVLGEDDVCFDDFVTSITRVSQRTSATTTPERSRLEQWVSSPNVEPAGDTTMCRPSLDRVFQQGNRFDDRDHHSPSSNENGVRPRAQEPLHQLVLQHQALIDQLSIELAVEREARIQLEDRVAHLEATATTKPCIEPVKQSPTPASNWHSYGAASMRRPIEVPALKAQRNGWEQFSREIPPSA